MDNFDTDLNIVTSLDTDFDGITDMSNNPLGDQVVFNSPYYKYKSSNKILSKVTNYLQKYSEEIEEQFNFYTNNKDYDEILSSTNYLNKKENQQKLFNNIDCNVYDYSNEWKLELLQPFKYSSNTLNVTDSNYDRTQPYPEIFYNGNKLEIKDTSNNFEFIDN